MYLIIALSDLSSVPSDAPQLRFRMSLAYLKGKCRHHHSSDMASAIHTEHLSHAFTTERDVEPVVVLEDISITLPTQSRTILVHFHPRSNLIHSSVPTVQVNRPTPLL